jgi:hypothetical protein
MIFTFSQAQEELSLFYQPDVLQSGLLMPTHSPRGNFNIGIGSTYFHMDLRGPRLASFFLGLDYVEELAEGLSRNYLSMDASFHVLDFGWRKNNIYYRMGYHSTSSFYIDFSPEFSNLLTIGNGGEVGRTIDLGPAFYTRHGNELYFGMSVPLYDDMYKFGGNIKLLTGVFDVSTPRNDINLTTGEEFYQITLENDFLLNASANDINFRLREFLPFNNPLRDNLGVSLDFGFQYNEGPWSFSVSLLDLGFTYWRSNTVNIESEGEFEFNGFSFDEITQDTLAVLADSLINVFGTTISNNNYLTYTPVKTILSAEYKVQKWRLGGMLYGEFKQNRFLPAIGVNATRRFWKFWDLGLSYAYKNNTYSNLGVHSIMNVGPVQFYALSDNVIGVFLPWQNWKVNFRVGGNLNFGLPKKMKVETNTAFLY